MQPAPRALIVGLGLIGGSIGIALRRQRWRIAYADVRVRMHEAQSVGAADRRGDLHDEYDLCVLATPVDVAIDLAPKLRGLTTSVCSVMAPLRAVVQASRFVAGHPMAGSAERGIFAANGDLFRGKRWFVDARDPLVERMIADCGAESELVDGKQHDAGVALTSHIPQLLSTALAAYTAERDVAKYAGTGLATFLRLAGSDASIWGPTLKANRAEIEPHLAALLRLAERIMSGDDAAFRQAQDFVKKLGIATETSG